LSEGSEALQFLQRGFFGFFSKELDPEGINECVALAGVRAGTLRGYIIVVFP
jgi:hypothetical protein